jgi:hypothetical protein
MRLVGRVFIPGIVFALLVVVVFWGGSLAGRFTGHWHSALRPADYARVLGW